MMWNRDQALILMPKFEVTAKFMGYHVALGGSVMYSGESNKDLDVVIYPHKRVDQDRPLPEMLMKMFMYHKLIAGYSDIAQTKGMDRTVFSGINEGRRIDFIFV
jgi:hypothetical protein